MSTDIYAKVRQRDGDTGERRDSENGGQLEGDREEMVVDIYESMDFRSSDVVSGPQEDMRDNARSHTRELCSKTVRRPFRAVVVCLGMLCVILLGGIIILLVVYYNSASDRYYSKLTMLETKLIMEREQHVARYNNMTLERDQLKHDINQLKKETVITPCSSGSWKKFGCSFYCKSTGWSTWQESRNQCVNIGADLVVINSKEEQEFIGRLSHEYTRSWIGLKRTGSIWTWLDGTPLTAQYWASGRPGDYLNWDCAYYLHKDGGWHNYKCSNMSINTICEK